MPIVKVMLCDKYSKAQQFSEKDVFYMRKYGVSCNTFNMTHLTEEFELYTKKIRASEREIPNIDQTDLDTLKNKSSERDFDAKK